jgi:hypothetical protein
MDEYLFLTMAKLKADRKKLEQEQRELARSERRELRPSKDERSTPTHPEFVPFLSWR